MFDLLDRAVVWIYVYVCVVNVQLFHSLYQFTIFTCVNDGQAAHFDYEHSYLMCLKKWSILVSLSLQIDLSWIQYWDVFKYDWDWLNLIILHSFTASNHNLDINLSWVTFPSKLFDSNFQIHWYFCWTCRFWCIQN